MVVRYAGSITGDDDTADRVFRALADSTRRDILRRTMATEWAVSDLAEQYLMSFAAVQKHVAVLERVDLVSKRRHGRQQLVTCNIERVRTARRLLDDLDELWRERMDRFESVLHSEPMSHEIPDTPVDEEKL